MERAAVTVSYAQTLDGRLATRSGNSQWISGPEALRFTHELRAAHDAIMVGVGTVLRDNPQLTVRLADGCNPVRVVVDSALSTPLTAAVLSSDAATNTLIAVTDRASADRRAAVEALGAQVLLIDSDTRGWVDLPVLLVALVENGLRSVMVEGGARLITSLLRAQLVDRLAICIAPKILGAGIEAVGDLEIDDLGHAVQLIETNVTRYGADLIVDGRLIYVEDTHAV
jgi:5-amino-6-(5-phosphoribosylamino)uracil reductase/diaminohydroxyphosphoribosylaminopyrimidine deaminase/5-amino-6-(5-phosphoribosylamino)uracil reductase